MIKLRLFNLYERFSHQIVGPVYRTFGKRLYQLGAALEGHMINDDRGTNTIYFFINKI